MTKINKIHYANQGKRLIQTTRDVLKKPTIDYSTAGFE